MSLALCSLVFWYGMCIRSWSSFKTLKNLETSPRAEADLRELLQFWTCYAIVALFDFYIEFFISWVPLYPLVKMGFLWYIITPATHGASVVFEQILEPKFNDKLFYLEKVFVVDGLSNFVELDWLYEQLTVQIGTRLNSVSQEQLGIIRNRIQALASLIDVELNQRQTRAMMLTSSSSGAALVNNPSSDEEEEVFEVITKERRSSPIKSTTSTPVSARKQPSVEEAPHVSPQDALLSAMNSFRDTLITMRGSPAVSQPSTQLQQQQSFSSLYYEREVALLEQRQQQQPPQQQQLPRYPKVAAPTFQPSFLPSRGVGVSPPQHQQASSAERLRRLQQQQQEEQEEEDVQEATLRSLEMDETTPRSHTPEGDEADSLLMDGFKAPSETPSALFRMPRFSWMSPRWPSFGGSSADLDAQNVQNQGVSQKQDEDEGMTGPVTRSRARKLHSSDSKENEAGTGTTTATTTTTTTTGGGGAKARRRANRRTSSGSLN